MTPNSSLQVTAFGSRSTVTGFLFMLWYVFLSDLSTWGGNRVAAALRRVSAALARSRGRKALLPRAAKHPGSGPPLQRWLLARVLWGSRALQPGPSCPSCPHHSTQGVTGACPCLLPASSPLCSGASWAVPEPKSAPKPASQTRAAPGAEPGTRGVQTLATLLSPAQTLPVQLRPTRLAAASSNVLTEEAGAVLGRGQEGTRVLGGAPAIPGTSRSRRCRRRRPSVSLAAAPPAAPPSARSSPLPAASAPAWTA